MRNIHFKLIVCLLLGLSGWANAQSYTAIHVIGDIYLPSKDAMLKRGDRIAETEKLEFRSTNAKAAMLSSKRGRYVIQAQHDNTIGEDNLAFVLSSVITPARGQMSTRAGGINNTLDFENKLGKEPIAWLNDELVYEISPIAYPINDNQFFYVSYQYNGETINKRLLSRDNAVVFNKSAFFSIDDQAIAPDQVSDMILYYYNASEQMANKITPVQLISVSKDDLASLQQAVADLPKEDQLSAIVEYVNSLYGSASEGSVQKALSLL